MKNYPLKSEIDIPLINYEAKLLVHSQYGLLVKPSNHSSCKQLMLIYVKPQIFRNIAETKPRVSSD